MKRTAWVFLASLGWLSACADTRPADPFEQRWREIQKTRGDPELLGSLLQTRPLPTVEDVLRALLPSIGDKPIEDTGISDPHRFSAWLAERNLTLSYQQLPIFPPYQVEVPIDWNADPHHNNSWRFYFQSLIWLEPFLDGDVSSLQVVGYVLSDYAERALYREPPLEFTWDEHPAKRALLVSKFLTRYAERAEIIDVQVARACLQILFSHLYALSSWRFYPEIPHNHGLMMDLSLIKSLAPFETLGDRDSMIALAMDRIGQQFDRSLTGDFVHVENSPGYHLMVLSWLVSVQNELRALGIAIPGDWQEKTAGMIDVLPYLFLPDNSLPRFGDTDSHSYSKEEVLEMLREDASDPLGLHPGLAYVLGAGQEGAPPEAVDRVFLQGGYACFRDRWPEAASYRDMIVAHLKFGHHSDTHYHEDDSSFSIHGYGTDIFVDSGFYNYEGRNPYTRYARGAFAHNVLVIDGKGNEPGEIGSTQILDYALGASCSFVHGRTAHNLLAGASPVTRTFVHIKPNAFLVVDELTASAPHRYEQHFHFHPLYQETREEANGGFLVTSQRPGTPSARVIPLRPIRFWSDDSGYAQKDGLRAWNFPSFGKSEPSKDLVLHYQENRGHLLFPVYLEIRPPDADSPPPQDFRFVPRRNGLELCWRQGQAARCLAVRRADSQPGTGQCEVSATQ